MTPPAGAVPPASPPAGLINRLTPVDLSADPLADLKREAPGPDGIRRGLVARLKQLIADGAYDTPDRWAAAEARLLERLAD